MTTQILDVASNLKTLSNPPLGDRGLTGSVALLEALVAENVEIIFGYPGGAIMPIYDALYDYQEQLHHQ